MSRDPKSGSAPFDCEVCEPRLDEATRARMHCAFLSPDEWRPLDRQSLPVLNGFDVMDENRPGTGRCPGGLIRRPFVAEVARAWRAYDKGSLETFFPQPSAALLDGVLVLGDALKAYEIKRLEDLPK